MGSFDSGSSIGHAVADELRDRVLSIYREVLGRASMSMDDDFFELGGDSLLGVQVASRVEEATRVEVPITFLFTKATPRELADWLSEELDAVGRGVDATETTSNAERA